MSSIPMPNWNPLPYAFSDRPFEKLPREAQNFLTQNNLYPATNYHTDTVNQVRRSRSSKLSRTVEGVHNAIVTKRRELASMNTNDIPWDELDTLGDTPCDPKDKCKYLLLQVVTVLYPELCDHLNDFILDMDSLVWLDVYVRHGTPDAVPLTLVHEYRASKSQPVLDASFNALAQLDTEVFRVDFHRMGVEREEALLRAMQELQNTPPPVYLEELEDEKEEAQFVVVSAVPLVEEKTPRWMDACKEIRGPRALCDSIGSRPMFTIL
ncbi:hypothetical protein L208DRAFT_1395827 [Tricholoma matsutake]|nr:hypothetical protein L208DRAFT_1395827 [Tricholoma matsutake 945]